MKVRMLAVISTLALAAWLPVQAQQAAPAQQSQPPAAQDANKPAAKPACCCDAHEHAGQAAAGHDHAAVACCHGKSADAAKASCCDAKDGHKMACCEQKGEASASAMTCCKDMKDGQCPAKDGKPCCGDKDVKSAQSCCTGMSDHCPAHSQGK